MLLALGLLLDAARTTVRIRLIVEQLFDFRQLSFFLLCCCESVYPPVTNKIEERAGPSTEDVRTFAAPFFELATAAAAAPLCS